MVIYSVAPLSVSIFATSVKLYTTHCVCPVIILSESGVITGETVPLKVSPGLVEIATEAGNIAIPVGIVLVTTRLLILHSDTGTRISY